MLFSICLSHPRCGFTPPLLKLPLCVGLTYPVCVAAGAPSYPVDRIGLFRLFVSYPSSVEESYDLAREDLLCNFFFSIVPFCLRSKASTSRFEAPPLMIFSL